MRAAVIVIAFILVIGGVGFGYIAINSKNNPQTSMVPQSTSSQAIVSANAQEASSQKVEVHSANGEANAILESISNPDGTTTYSLYACDATCDKKTLVYEDTVATGAKIEVPFNSWSPDHTYLFVVKKSGGTADYLVFKSSGEVFNSGEKFIDILPVFAEKQPNLVLKDITGWDSETLLHVFTNTQDGKNGPSFWFEIPSTALIQLGSH